MRLSASPLRRASAHLEAIGLAFGLSFFLFAVDLPVHRVSQVLGPISLPGLSVLRSPASLVYPRLANYNGYQLAAEAPAFVQDNLIIAAQSAADGDPSPVSVLRRFHPHAIILMYQRTLQVDYPFIEALYGTKDIFPGWWLLRAGSSLTANVDSSQTEIPVANPARFRLYDDVLVDGETMHVRGIAGRMLEVQRGFYSQAAAHAAGSHIATHYSYRTDLRNSTIEGGHENRRPWSFNLASTCPRDPQGRTWNDFLANLIARMMGTGQWDGVFFDNTNELLRDPWSDPWVDVNNDDLPDGGVVKGHNVWHDGQLYLFQRFHQLVPSAAIMYNGTLDAGATANGRELEGFPLLGGGYMPAMDDYSYWSQRSALPPMVIVNPDTVRSPRPDLGAMRFGLASTLLGNGFFTYDEGWHRHGAVWNFDEYDNGAGSALLHDLGVGDTQVPVLHQGRFHAGDVVLVGREQMLVLHANREALLVRRGSHGTTATTHPAGSIVATPAQIAAGTGYLGRALGPATSLLPPLEEPNLVVNGDFSENSYRWFLRNLGVHLGAAGVNARSTPARQAGAASPALLATGASGSLSATAHSFEVEVPWQSVRSIDIIALTQVGIPVQPGSSYTLTFWARGVIGMPLPVLLTGERPSRYVRYAPFTITLHKAWSRYILRYTAPADVQQIRISFLFGHTFGRTALSGISLQPGQALVYSRAFQHGLVLVNQGDTAQYISLPRTYWHLRGDQDPEVNDGNAIRSLWLQPHAGLILLNYPPA